MKIQRLFNIVTIETSINMLTVKKSYLTISKISYEEILKVMFFLT